MRYRMPAEWEEHERCYMSWPCRAGLWASDVNTRKSYAEVAHAIREFEPLTMIVPPRLMADAHNYLGSDIDLLEIPIDDSWSRDNGPIFVVDGEGGIAGVNFGFNAWGGKYHPYDQDALLAERLLAHLGVPCISSTLIAEMPFRE